MSSRIKIRAQQADGITEVKALMRHPMETGMRKDQAGESIPAHFITEVAVFHGERGWKNDLPGRVSNGHLTGNDVCALTIHPTLGHRL